MKNFYHLLSNSLIAIITTNFVWFSAIYWAYLETKSVLATSFMGGAYLVAAVLCGFWFGAIVDHHKKKTAFFVSSVATLAFFILSFGLYLSAPAGAFTSVNSGWFWAVIISILLGTIAANIRHIALPTATTILVAPENRDKANGMSGTVLGTSFMVASIASGFVLGWFGMVTVLIIGIVLTIAALLHLFLIPIVEPEIVHVEGQGKKLDLKGTIKVIKDVPGLPGLIIFNTLNNFIGGVFMALMDPYALSLISVQVWGTLWGILSSGFIISGIYISKKGVGKKPLLAMFNAILLTWVASTFFTIQPSIILLSVGVFMWIMLIPFIEAAEQTVIQKVVPAERQGRIFGFSQSVESAASPVTAFMIGPIAQFIFIPFMTTGRGVDLIGSWFGTGAARGIALVFIVVGVIGFALTVFAMRSKSYHLLANRYAE